METRDVDGGFVLEVTRFVPMLATDTLPVEALADLDAAVSRCDGEREMVFGLVCEEGAGGVFSLFVSGDRAWVHLSAGPCVTARGRAALGQAEPVVFRLDNGQRRAVPVDQTVSREEGLQALRYWFCTGQQWPGLEWDRA